MKSPKLVAGMVGIFFGSFLFFLYLSFPYGVLKEAISTKVEAETGMSVRMESLGLGFPIGLSAENVEVSMKSSPRFKLKDVSVNWDVLQLFLLRAGVSIGLRDEGGGTLNLGIGYGLFSLLTGSFGLPSVISLQAKKLTLDSLMDFAVYALVDRGVAGPLAGPLLSKIGIKGKLSANSQVSLNSSNTSLSSGNLDLKLSDAVLVLSDPSFGFPDQSFKTATISVAATNGSLNIDPSTRFTTEDLELGVDGKMTLNPKFSTSPMNLKAFVHLKGALGEQFGSLIDAISGGISKDGAINLQIGGTVSTPKYDPI